MQATHWDAENRYSKLRQAVIDEVNKELAIDKRQRVKASLINHSALKQSESWKLSPNRMVDWDWVEGYNTFKYRNPKRFELALWHGKSLVSLSLGRPTYRGSKMRLDFLEGNPDKPKDVKVFEPNLIALIAYADILDADEVRLMNPINDIVRSYYEKFGFQYVTKGDYLFLRL